MSTAVRAYTPTHTYTLLRIDDNHQTFSLQLQERSADVGKSGVRIRGERAA